MNVSWGEFKQQAASLSAEEHRDGGTLLFRGHASENWKLETTLERSSLPDDDLLAYYDMVLKLRPEIESFTGHSWADTPSWDEISGLFQNAEKAQRAIRYSIPHYSYLAHLRHHSFPSPFLDWSSSPFVAAYFAFASANEASQENVAIYAYREFGVAGIKQLYGDGQPTVALLGPYIGAPKRHFSQRSWYTICTEWKDRSMLIASHEDVCQPFDENKIDQTDVIYKFVIPAASRSAVLQELMAYNLTAYSLFGTEDSLMETLALRHDLSSRGY